jgi:acyl-CoA synthetase (AMP-forming)/AMP-acid ligase II
VRPLLSDPPRRLTGAADPLAAFRLADAAGEPVALETSGSSGTPRRVVRTTASWTCSFEPVARLTGLTARSRVWVPGPLAATMNLFAAVHASYAGAALVEDPADATHAQLTPTALRRCLDQGVPLRGRTVVVAGDQLSSALHRRATEAGARVHHYYGAAELSFVAWGSHADDLRPFPGTDLAVRAGEIWVRSPYLCLGYESPPDPPGPLRMRDGWATVGDRGRLVAGRLAVAGRPGAVTVGGATVEVADVEAVLRPAAAGELVVVGVPNARLGTVLAVVLADETDHVPVLRAARRQLTGARRPRLWFHAHELPRTPAGKLDRQALAAIAGGGSPGLRRLPSAGRRP